ncbi:hypothetical protein LR48_Vigan07g041500, partial [Vigna angularis]
IHFVLLISRQGKVRLTKWYSPYSQKERSKVCELDLIFNFHKEDLVEVAKIEASSLTNIIAQATK